MMFALWLTIGGALLVLVTLGGSLLARLPLSTSMLYLGVGANYGLSDRLAIRAALGAAQGPSSDGRNFKTNSAGLGMTYRFSLPGW